MAECSSNDKVGSEDDDDFVMVPSQPEGVESHKDEDKSQGPDGGNSCQADGEGDVANDDGEKLDFNNLAAFQKGVQVTINKFIINYKIVI